MPRRPDPPRRPPLNLWIALLGLALAALAGCAEPVERASHAAAPAPSTASAPVVRPEPAAAPCEDGERRCAGEGSAQVCAGGAWQDQPCGADARCIGIDGPEALCRPTCAEEGFCTFMDDAWLPSARGFINRWRIAGPFERKAAKKAGDTQGLVQQADADGRWETRAFHDDILQLEPRRGGRDKRESVYLLRAEVYSPVARRVRLRPSITGRMELFINDASVFEATEERWLMVDDHRVDVDLRAGVNTVLLRVDQLRPRALRLALRVRDTDNRPLPDLLWSVSARPLPTPSSPCRTLQIDTRLRPVAEGFDVDVELSAPGLVSLPRPNQKPRSVRVVINDDPKDDAGPPAAAAPLDVPALLSGSQRLALSAKLDTPGTRWLHVSIGGKVCTTISLLGRPDLQQRLASVEERLLPLLDLDELPEGSRASLTHHADLIRAAMAQNDPDTRWIKRMLDELEELVSAARAGDPYAERSGIITRAYRSPYDGQLQHYVAWVPPSYVRAVRKAREKDEGFPLVVTFHGLNGSPDEMLRITAGVEREMGVSREAFARTPFELRDDGVILVAPWGYGNIGQRTIGEVDVMRVIDEMKAAYRIDPQRVSLTGASLGGTVAFVVPLHYPDAFAAAAPLCGYPNIRTYGDVQSARRRPWEDWLIEQRAVINVAESGLHLPLFITHGTLDGPDRSEGIVKRYKALGYKVEFDTPELGHNVWDHAYAKDKKLLRTMAWRRIPQHPRHVRLRSAHWRYSSAHWLRIDRFSDPQRFGDLDATRSKDTLKVDTINVEAFTILGARLAEEPGTWTLEINGRRIAEVSSEQGDLHLARRDKRWALVDVPDVVPGGKRAGLSGPLDDIWFSPFIVIYGTQDPRQTEANRLVAEHMAQYNLRAELHVPVRADHEVTEQDLLGRGVVLIGNPRSNAIARRAAEALPIQFEEQALVFFGRRYEGQGVGLSFIHPSPFDPDQYLVWHAGVGEEGTLSARHLPEYVPDFLVYDEGIRSEYWGPVLDKREVLDGGFFDPAWKLP